MKISSVFPRALTISTTPNYISPVYPRFNNSLKKRPMKSPWTPISLRKSRKKSRKISPWHTTESRSNFKPKNLPWFLKIRWMNQMWRLIQIQMKQIYSRVKIPKAKTHSLFQVSFPMVRIMIRGLSYHQSLQKAKIHNKNLKRIKRRLQKQNLWRNPTKLIRSQRKNP